MKRFFCILLVIFTIFTFTSCYGDIDYSEETLIYNDTESDDMIIAPHIHSWGEWMVLQESTCTVLGIERRECSCGEIQKQNLTLKQHDYKAVVTEPTVDAEGYTTYICDCGESYISDRIPAKIENRLVTDGVATAKIVISAEASRYVFYAKDRIQLSVNDLVGVSLAEDGEASFEILIGDTGRAESDALISTLSADEYAIKADGKKIVIVASNEAFLYEAAKYFVDNYLKEPYARVTESDIILLTEDINVKRTGDKNSIHYKLSLDTKPCASAIAEYTLDNQKYGVTGAEPRIYRRQGGCFNGENYYQAFITKNEELAVIAKKNIKTGEIIYSEPRLMDHANDLTYDPYNNRVFVGSGKTVWIYDADTLEFIESKTFSHTTSKFSYSPQRHIYVLGSYYFYDDSLTYTKKYFKGSLSTLVDSSNMSAQGSACDDTFIYSLLFDSIDGVYNCYFSVYDWYGNIVAVVTVDIPGDFEPENISIVDGTLYIAACSTQPVATLYSVEFQ